MIRVLPDHGLKSGLYGGRNSKLAPAASISVRHRLTLAALTPHRDAAVRWLAPSATDFKTRSRRSTESAFDIQPASIPADILNQSQRRLGIPNDSIRSEDALARHR